MSGKYCSQTGSCSVFIPRKEYEEASRKTYKAITLIGTYGLET